MSAERKTAVLGRQGVSGCPQKASGAQAPGRGPQRRAARPASGNEAGSEVDQGGGSSVLIPAVMT